MQFIPTAFADAWLIQPKVWADGRGFFFESYSQRHFTDAGIDITFVQDNQSKSCRGTLRGLHYQKAPHAQDKLVRVLAGEVVDVIVDLRSNSPTYRQWQSYRLSAENHLMLLVPKGFAHGFCVTSDTAEVLYKCSDFYAPDSEHGLCWNDPELGIDWPIHEPLLSPRDRCHPCLRDLPVHF